MFHAIEKAKIRSQFSIDNGKSWREIYHQSEDFLTAAVFGRLIYLPSNLLWNLIRKISFNSELPEHVGYLENYEFWPRWEIEESYREPDVFLQFKEIDVIIEAKLGDKANLQSPEQWAKEIIAKISQEDEDKNPTKPILLFAVGGFRNDTNKEKEEFFKKKEECEKILLKELPNLEKIFITGGTWKSLQVELKKVLNYLSAEHKLQEKYKTDCFERLNLYHLVKDIINILAFHGIKEWRYFSNIIEDIQKYKINSESIKAFSLKGGKR